MFENRISKEKHWGYDNGFKLSIVNLLQKNIFKKDMVLVEIEKNSK